MFECVSNAGQWCVAVQLQIEEITRRLQTGELGIPPIGERFVLCACVNTLAANSTL